MKLLLIAPASLRNLCAFMEGRIALDQRPIAKRPDFASISDREVPPGA
jgi:hypothetical protein